MAVTMLSRQFGPDLFVLKVSVGIFELVQAFMHSGSVLAEHHFFGQESKRDQEADFAFSNLLAPLYANLSMSVTPNAAPEG